MYRKWLHLIALTCNFRNARWFWYTKLKLIFIYLGKNVDRTFSSLRNTTIALLFRSSLTTSVVSITATKSATKSVLHVESCFFLLIKPVAFYFLVSIVLSFPPASKWLSRREKNERKDRGLCRPPTGVSLATSDAFDRGTGVLWKILRDKEMPRTPFVIV